MEVAITKMSENGQVVIPSEIRKEAGIEPATKFIVLNKKGDIYLKRIDKKMLRYFGLVERVGRSERQIKEGKYLEVDTRMSPDEIDKIIMSKNEGCTFRRIPKGTKKNKR